VYTATMIETWMPILGLLLFACFIWWITTGTGYWSRLARSSHSPPSPGVKATWWIAYAVTALWVLSNSSCEGPEQVARLARAIEEIGYDQLDMFDHVVMGFPTDVRPAPIYPPQMPIMEAIVVLSFAAAVTSRIGLGTEVLVLPQRQPVLVAKQISTLDTLSAGRVRLGVGVGWQASEFQALGEDFSNRGRRMDEAIDLLLRRFENRFHGGDDCDMVAKDAEVPHLLCAGCQQRDRGCRRRCFESDCKKHDTVVRIRFRQF